MHRSSGVLLHVSSLPGKYGCGDFGRGATEFIDKAAACGFSLWQVLPFCVPDRYASPYSSMSTFSGNPYFIDLEELHRRGLLTADELAAAEQKSPYACEFERLGAERLPLLFRAAARAAQDPDTVAAVDAFIATNPRVAEFCLFMAKRTANGGSAWQEWTTDGFDDRVLFAWRFIQYEFFTEWANVKAYANSNGISVIGDIPFYVALDSSDVWGSRSQFLLDRDGRPEWVAGVPPDYFSADGQLWGNPLYDWKHMKADGWSFWRDRLTFMLSMFDGIRIDHFRAVESYFAIPGDADTAREGKWRRGPGLEFAKMIKDIAGDKLIIAEDLGYPSPEVVQLLSDSGLPGMKVLEFAFDSRDPSDYLPHSCNFNSICYTGTHDNAPLALWRTEADKADIAFAVQYLGLNDREGFNRGIIRGGMSSVAKLFVAQMQDWLDLGAGHRMNIPGTSRGNWEWRMLPGEASKKLAGQIREMTRIYGRS